MGSDQSQSPSQPPLHHHRLLEPAPLWASGGQSPLMRQPGASPAREAPSASLQAQGRPPRLWGAPGLACTLLGWLHALPWSPLPAGHTGNQCPLVALSWLWPPPPTAQALCPSHRAPWGSGRTAAPARTAPRQACLAPGGHPVSLETWQAGPGRVTRPPLPAPCHQCPGSPLPTQEPSAGAPLPSRTLSYQRHTRASPGRPPPCPSASLPPAPCPLPPCPPAPCPPSPCPPSPCPPVPLPPECAWPRGAQPRAGPPSLRG